MSRYAIGVNPKILKWSRLKAGYSIEEIAMAFKKDISVIESWESGETYPTYVQLETLAYKYYKRPIALFFFPEPPEEIDTEKSFRTLPSFEIKYLVPDTLYAIRQGNAMQFILREINDGINPSKRKIFKDIKINTTYSVVEIANLIRQYLQIDLSTQMSWKTYTEALSNWRNIVEDVGIFIFKRPFKQKDISGFCLNDSEFPIIYLNSSSSKSRQIFTIFHELTHILLNENSITKENNDYIDFLTGEKKEIEIFCNKLSAEFLVPTKAISYYLFQKEINLQTITELAEKFKVSREVILRKLYDKKLINKEFYETQSQNWNEEIEDNKENNFGNYYHNQFSYLGEKFLKLAFSKYYKGKYGIEQLSEYLNVKVKNIPGLEQLVLSR